MYANVPSCHILDICIWNIHSHQVLKHLLLDKCIKTHNNIKVDPSLLKYHPIPCNISKVQLYVRVMCDNSQTSIRKLLEHASYNLLLSLVLQECGFKSMPITRMSRLHSIPQDLLAPLRQPLQYDPRWSTSLGLFRRRRLHPRTKLQWYCRQLLTKVSSFKHLENDRQE